MNPNRKIPRSLPVIILLFVAYSAYRIWPGSPGAPITVVTLNGPTMGTTYQVKLASGLLAPEAKEALQKAVQSELNKVDQAMSTYLKTSELSQFNQNKSIEPVRLSDETFEVLLLAQSISKLSGGAFDVTVGPLVNAWGFGPTQAHQIDDATLKALRDRIGFEKLTLDATNKTATKTRADIYVDLSAIAKGYAVDKISERLLELGQAHHMVEVGGEIRVHGLNGDKQPWRLGIERPADGARMVHEVLPLSNHSMATSGDYRNFIEKNGKRYSHTIDPRLGRPVNHGLASVTVITATCARADALATALNVLGPQLGFDLAQREKIAALFIIREPNGEFSNKASDEFEKLRSPQTASH